MFPRKHHPRCGIPAPSEAWMPWWSRYLVLEGVAVIVVATSVAYFPALRGGFVLDDGSYVTDNRLITTPEGLYRFWCTTEAIDYYPVSNTTFWLEWRLWGMNPTGYHVTNLVLHIAARC